MDFKSDYNDVQYSGLLTFVRVNAVPSEEFEVKMGVHQGLVLSPLLFVYCTASSVLSL